MLTKFNYKLLFNVHILVFDLNLKNIKELGEIRPSFLGFLGMSVLTIQFNTPQVAIVLDS